MKNVLFATTASAALLIGGVASAQGITLFGDARLGLGYNINNDGSTAEDDGDDLRAISRVRFGVNMTGETDSGITFGATIRADNSRGGQGNGPIGQSDGSVFVSGNWGTLTYGDTNGADEQWVGDVPGDLSVTGLADRDETLFISNGGQFGSESGGSFASNPAARPTVRYDFDIAGFGVSVSSNRDLDDVVVGTGYSADFGGGSWSIGAGYNDFSAFTIPGETEIVSVDTDGDGIDDAVTVVNSDPQRISSGSQWSVGLKGTYDKFSFGATYANADADDGDESFETLLVGLEFGFGDFTVGGFYGNILSADGDFADADGNDTFAVTGEYDLGGGASVNMGVGQDYEDNTVGDFGIVMAF